MTTKYTVYFADNKPYYLRKPKPVKGMLADYIKEPDKLQADIDNYEDTIKQLEQERDDQRDKYKKQQKDNKVLVDFIKKDLGFNSFNDAQAFLQGEKLPDFVKRLEQERNNARDAEKITQKTADKLQADLNKFVGLMTKWGVNDLIELNLLLDGWSKFPVLNQNVNNLLNKESVADLKELDDKITGIKQNLQTTAQQRNQAQNQRDTYKNERDAERQKIAQGKDYFGDIAKAVNKKSTVIFGDVMPPKKKIRRNMSKLKSILGWSDVETDAETSDEE